MALTYLVPAIYDAALSVFSFALPLYLVDMGVPPLVIGSLLALPSVVQIFARIPAGLVAGRVGNIAAMLAGCALMTASGLLIANAPVAAVATFVAVAQVLSGLGRACFWPANQAHLFELAGDRIGSYIGIYNFVVTIGGMTGPLLAGLLIVKAGPAAAFWLLALLTAVSGVSLVVGRNRSAARLGHGPAEIVATPGRSFTRDAGAQVGRVARSPGVWLAGLVCIASVVPFTVTTSFYPVLLKSHGMSAASISLLATVRMAAVALFSLVTGPYVRPGRRADLLGLSGLLGALGMALIPALAASAVGVLPMLLFGFCGGAMHNVQMAIAGEAVRPGDRALSMALVGSIGNIAMALTPLWHGWMASQGWLEGAFPLTGLALAAVSVGSWQWARRMDARATAAGQRQQGRQQPGQGGTTVALPSGETAQAGSETASGAPPGQI